MLSKEILEHSWKGSCVPGCARMQTNVAVWFGHAPRSRLNIVSTAKCLYMAPWQRCVCVEQRRLFWWGWSEKVCWSHNDIKNKQWWMGTWSLRNHKTLNGKSLSHSTGRPRRQGVKETPTVLGCMWVTYSADRRVCVQIWGRYSPSKLAE